MLDVEVKSENGKQNVKSPVSAAPVAGISDAGIFEAVHPRKHFGIGLQKFRASSRERSVQ